MNFLKATLLGNSLSRWFLAVVIAAATFAVLKFFQVVLSKQLSQLAKKSKIEWDDLIAELLEKRVKSFFIIALAIFAGSLFLTLPPRISWVIRAITIVAIFVQVAIWGTDSISWLTLRARKKTEHDPESFSTYSALAFIGKLVLWSILLMLVLHNLGINVTTVIASLGIGGIAVALAVQNILGDLFASMAIILDKPFIVGDFIIVGDQMGTVERIGLKTSRIRSLSGEQIVFSNNDLLSSRIRNFKRMWERRVVFSVGVTYQTPREKLEAIPGMLQEIIEREEQARFDRAHFKSYGDFALIFEMVYYVKDPAYGVYMDTQQAINLEIFRRFEDEGIEFAYPTQTLFLVPQQPQGESGEIHP
jgi:small-conductance mechanosensitive channel